MKTLEEYIEQLHKSEKIFNILTDKNYLREIPTGPGEISNRIRESIINHEEIRIMLLWGGSKKGISADMADTSSLDFISEIQTNIRKNYYHCQIYLLFCDMHHVLANGVDFEETKKYYNSLEDLVKRRSLNIIKLSELIGNYGIEGYSDIYSRISGEKIININEAFESLIIGTKKHSLLCSKFLIEDIARIYTEIEIYFLKKINEKYSNQIFASFSNPIPQKIIAEEAKVPMLFLNSDNEGHHECPWYVLLKKLYVRGIETEEFRKSNLPFDLLRVVSVDFKSNLNINYWANHVLKHPTGRYILLVGEKKDKKDFENTIKTLASINECWYETNIDEREDDICTCVMWPKINSNNDFADLVESYKKYFKDVRIDCAIYDKIPESIYNNPGFPIEKIKFEIKYY
jgi:hypothetical protein